jgi:hypothetical protein
MSGDLGEADFAARKAATLTFVLAARSALVLRG